MDRLKSGNREVDEILGGGFPRNAIHVLMGAPGTGKTILAEQLCFANASSDRPILYLATFSEPLQKLVSFLQEFRFADVEKLGTEIVYEYVGEDLLTAPERAPERVQSSSPCTGPDHRDRLVQGARGPHAGPQHLAAHARRHRRDAHRVRHDRLLGG